MLALGRAQNEICLPSPAAHHNGRSSRAQAGVWVASLVFRSQPRVAVACLTWHAGEAGLSCAGRTKDEFDRAVAIHSGPLWCL